MLWRITLFGGLRAIQSDHALTRFRTRKTGALLGYLAYFLPRTHPRGELVELFWPECAPQAGRDNLSVSLSSLRRQLEPPGISSGAVIIADRAAVRLNPDAVTTDVAEFEGALRSAQRAGAGAGRLEDLTRAVELYQGELLPCCDEDWVLQERQWLAERYFQALSELLAHLERGGDVERALAYARRGVRADPLREEAHHDLIRLLAAAQPAAALRQYEEMERLLARDLGDEPSADLRALAMALHEQCSLAQSPTATEPPLPRVSASPASSLPLPLDRFFGRRSELARLIALLRPLTSRAFGDEERLDERAPPRLITLTGPGGSGKTRLAVEVARRLQPRSSAPICFVPLQGLTPCTSPGPDGTAFHPPILEEVRDALRLPRTPGADPLEQIVTALAQQPTLLILDNFEHLVEGGAPLVLALLQRVATLTILVASRRRLNLPGERDFPVLPLPVPRVCDDPGGPDRFTMDHATLLSNPSVALFVDRAQQARPDFQLTPGNAADVERLCARLEGIPLAIELAAGRAGVLTPGQILERLLPPFALLVNRRPGVEERQRSLRATLAWSYQLLPLELQRFFTRLSIFRGGWTLEAATEVCEPAEALDHLEQLHECSLIAAEEAVVGAAEQSEAVMRYRLLETLREYGAEHLAAGETMTLARRHAAFFLELAEQAEPWMRSPERYAWLSRLEAELDNFRTALAWCLDHGPGFAPTSAAELSDGRPEPLDSSLPSPLETGLRLAAALAEFWAYSGHAGEGRDWLGRLLERAGGPGRTVVRAKALAAAGRLAASQYDEAGSIRLLEESIALWREVEHPAGLAQPLCLLGLAKAYQGEFAAARALLEECVALARELGDRWTLAAAVDNQGRLAQLEGDLSGSRVLLEEARSLTPEVGAEETLASIVYRLGYVAEMEGHLEEARELYQQSMAVTSTLPAADHSCCFRELGRLARLRGDYTQARALLEECLALRHRLGQVTYLPPSLSQLADLALCQGDFATANALAGQSLALARARQDRGFMAGAFCVLGRAAYQQGELEQARRLLEEARCCASERGRAVVSIDLAELLAGLGKHDQAEGLFAESRASLRLSRDRLDLSHLLRRQGRVELRYGEWKQAAASYRESLCILQERGVREGVPDSLEGVAGVALAAGVEEAARPAGGQPEPSDEPSQRSPWPPHSGSGARLAARLLGAAEAMREAMGAPLPPVYWSDHERMVACLGTLLGEQEAGAEWAKGRAMSPEQAVEAALASL